MVLDRRPTAAEEGLIRASIDVPRANLVPSEWSTLLPRLREERNSSVSELHELMGISQGFGSKFLAIRRFAPDVLRRLEAGELDIERAYIPLAGDATSQPNLAEQASTLSRGQLRQRVKVGAAKDDTAGFPMPGHGAGVVRGQYLTLARVVELLAETTRVLRKGLSQGLDLDTQPPVLRDQARATPRPAERASLRWRRAQRPVPAAPA